METGSVSLPFHGQDGLADARFDVSLNAQRRRLTGLALLVLALAPVQGAGPAIVGGDEEGRRFHGVIATGSDEAEADAPSFPELAFAHEDSARCGKSRLIVRYDLARVMN